MMNKARFPTPEELKPWFDECNIRYPSFEPKFEEFRTCKLKKLPVSQQLLLKLTYEDLKRCDKLYRLWFKPLPGAPTIKNGLFPTTQPFKTKPIKSFWGTGNSNEFTHLFERYPDQHSLVAKTRRRDDILDLILRVSATVSFLCAIEIFISLSCLLCLSLYMNPLYPLEQNLLPMTVDCILLYFVAVSGQFSVHEKQSLDQLLKEQRRKSNRNRYSPK